MLKSIVLLVGLYTSIALFVLLFLMLINNYALGYFLIVIAIYSILEFFNIMKLILEKNKIKQNKISYLKEQIQAIEEWSDIKAPTWYNNVGVNTPELEEEKWDIDIEKIKQEADDALEKYNEALEKLENE